MERFYSTSKLYSALTGVPSAFHPSPTSLDGKVARRILSVNIQHRSRSR